MHSLLKRHLKEFGLSKDTLPDKEKWSSLLDKINDEYLQLDKVKYDLELNQSNSLMEMHQQYQNQKDSYETRQAAILKAFPDVLFLMSSS